MHVTPGTHPSRILAQANAQLSQLPPDSPRDEILRFLLSAVAELSRQNMALEKQIQASRNRRY